jgi:hypothetical protein
MSWKNSVAVAGGANSNEFSKTSPLSKGDPSSAETSDVSDESAFFFTGAPFEGELFTLPATGDAFPDPTLDRFS